MSTATLTVEQFPHGLLRVRIALHQDGIKMGNTGMIYRSREAALAEIERKGWTLAFLALVCCPREGRSEGQEGHKTPKPAACTRRGLPPRMSRGAPRIDAGRAGRRPRERRPP